MKEEREGYGIWKLNILTPSHPSLQPLGGKTHTIYNEDSRSILYPCLAEEYLKGDYITCSNGLLTMKSPLHFSQTGLWGKNIEGRRSPFGNVLTKSRPRGDIVEGTMGYRSSAVRLSGIIVKEDPCSICTEGKGTKVFPIRGGDILLCNKCYSAMNKVSRKGLDLPDISKVYETLSHRYDTKTIDARDISSLQHLI